MWPLVILGGAAAALLSGCFTKPGPKSPQALKPPPPKPKNPYTTEFSKDQQVHWYYLQLKLRGISDQALDQGCPSYDFRQKGNPVLNLLGPRNQSISKCEVYEYIFSHDDDQKIHPLAEAFTGKPFPLALDDPDPLTHIYLEKRKEIDEVLGRIKQDIKDLGHAPGTPEYQERLAIALMAYVGIPFKGSRYFQLIKQGPGVIGQHDVLRALSSLKQEFSRAKMSEIWNYLEGKGGLVPQTPLDDKERTAIGAIAEGVGKCTENSKVLFALLRLAGLDPIFIYVNPWASREPALKKIAQDLPNYEHVAVGIKVEGKMQIYDPSLLLTKLSHSGAYPLTPRQYLARDFNNRTLNASTPEEVMEIVNRGLELDPDSYSLHLRKANAHAALGQKEAAFRSNLRAQSLAPHIAQTNLLLALAYGEMGDLKKAMAIVQKVKEKNPGNPLVYYTRAQILYVSGKSSEGYQDLVETAKLSPEFVYKQLSRTFLANTTKDFVKKPEDERQRFREETLISDVPQMKADFGMAKLFSLAGHLDWAAKKIAPYLIQLDSSRRTLQKNGRDFSQSTAADLREEFEELPKKLKEHPQIQPLWVNLNL